MLKEAFRKMSQPLEDSEFKAVLPLGTQLLMLKSMKIR